MDELDENRVHLNEGAEKIDTESKIVYTAKGEYHYEYLINTAALPSFIKLAGGGAADILNYNQVLVLNIGFDKPSIDKAVSWAYYPGDEFFYRVGFYNNIAGTERLSIYVEIGYKANEEIDIAAAMEQTLIDLKKVNIIDDHKVVAYKPYIINPGYAHITTNGKAYTDKTIADMESRDVYMIGRYAKWQYSAMDDSLEQAFALANKI